MELLTRNLPAGPLIAPTADDAVRPLLSVMIPVYNPSEQYLTETLESVLLQDPGPEQMEIGVVDNCSTEIDAEPIVRRIGKDRVQFFRQTRNIGAIENFNSCIQRARGEWVHILHADDTILPDFYSRARDAIAMHPHIGAVACRHVFIDEDGTWLSISEPQARTPRVLGDDFVERQLIGQRLHFVSLIVRRSAYETLGGFRSVFKHCTDWDMWNRLVLTYPVFYIPDILACNRLYAGSGTDQAIRTGENVREERLCVTTYLSYLPRQRGKQLYRDAMAVAGKRALRHSYFYWKHGDLDTVLHQLWEVLRCAFAAATVGIVSPFHDPSRLGSLHLQNPSRREVAVNPPPLNPP
jgi:glycosyltransferase involved in cell wall biosynthesis